MARVFKRERAAAVLADAAYFGDKEAVALHGVSIQSLTRWRHLLEVNADPILSNYVACFIRIKSARWLSRLPKSLEATIAALNRFAEKTEHSAEEVGLLIESLKMQAQVDLANKLLDEQRSTTRGGILGEPTPAVSGAEVDFIVDDSEADSIPDPD